MRNFMIALMAATCFIGCSESAVDSSNEGQSATPSASSSLPPAPSQEKPWKLIHSQGVMNFVHMQADHREDQDQYRLAIADICGGKNICQVSFWTDASLVPKSLPMSDPQVSAMTANWQYNGNTGHRKLLWACDIVSDPNECFSN